MARISRRGLLVGGLSASVTGSIPLAGCGLFSSIFIPMLREILPSAVGVVTVEVLHAVVEKVERLAREYFKGGMNYVSEYDLGQTFNWCPPGCNEQNAQEVIELYKSATFHDLTIPYKFGTPAISGDNKKYLTQFSKHSAWSVVTGFPDRSSTPVFTVNKQILATWISDTLSTTDDCGLFFNANTSVNVPCGIDGCQLLGMKQVFKQIDGTPFELFYPDAAPREPIEISPSEFRKLSEDERKRKREERAKYNKDKENYDKWSYFHTINAHGRSYPGCRIIPNPEMRSPHSSGKKI